MAWFYRDTNVEPSKVVKDGREEPGPVRRKLNLIAKEIGRVYGVIVDRRWKTNSD